MVCAGRCPNTVRRGYCEACACEKTRSDEQARSVQSKERKPFYDSRRWRATRKVVLYEQPWCDGWGPTKGCCGKLATEVDHIVPRANGGDEFARVNLQGLCKPCHSRKTAYENRLGRNRATGNEVA